MHFSSEGGLVRPVLGERWKEVEPVSRRSEHNRGEASQRYAMRELQRPAESAEECEVDMVYLNQELPARRYYRTDREAESAQQLS